MRKSAQAALSRLESKIMRVVWQQEEATADAVRTSLAASAPLKDSTVRTILRRLEQKGYVTHRSLGRTYIYSPKIAPRNAAVAAVRGIIQRLCNGSVEDLLLGMVDQELLSSETLQALAEQIEAVDAKRAAHIAKKQPRRAGH
jgi:BlaI family penicillinase repressor